MSSKKEIGVKGLTPIESRVCKALFICAALPAAVRNAFQSASSTFDFFQRMEIEEAKPQAQVRYRTVEEGEMVFARRSFGSEYLTFVFEPCC